jgi:hypothetical protein
MVFVFFLTALIAAADPPTVEIPIRVGNAQFDPLDLSVTYEYVNDALDVTAYEVSITRYFADGSKVVSTQGQDWFSSTGVVDVGVVVNSIYCAWLPGRPGAIPGTHVHLWPSRSKPKASLIDADVTLTAVVRLDGSAVGRRRVLERIFAERRALLAEYAYWIPHLERARATELPLDALASAVELLKRERPEERSSKPHEALLRAATHMQLWSDEHPDDAPRLLDAIIATASHQVEMLIDQSVQRESVSTTNRVPFTLGDERVCR